MPIPGRSSPSPVPRWRHGVVDVFGSRSSNSGSSASIHG
ncbi:hypothetical protein SCE1572_28930 [Sorangium cellulosum So0157-2]|uniref:Uncharacterized protein n=1 Tax=Sorangium cellulosum So0157-2 TaxID=1254432 RepID=S4Y069_SORCE|nr:hypothetical protein SCE1572_28930 [Sorangium cellulosum So0157-2]